MKRFGGFPAKMRFTAVPEPFFSHLLPDIADIAELKTTLAIFRTLYRKRGYVRYVGLSELMADTALMRGLDKEGQHPGEKLAAALEMTVERGTVLRMDVTLGNALEQIYFLNSESDRRIMQKIRSGELAFPGLTVKEPAVVSPDTSPDIFTLYEQNVGMLTPMIADELLAAQKEYPEDWIHEAIREAANQNKRRWSYISTILERWRAEGKTDGAYRANPKRADPDKYVKGRYGHMVQR